MGEAPAHRWMNAEHAARYLDIHLDAFRRKVAGGVLPKPSYSLGSRTPRWWSGALDVVMDPGTASMDPRVAVNALAEKIEAEGRSRRQAQAR